MQVQPMERRKGEVLQTERFRHAALFDGLRHMLPSLRAEANALLTAPLRFEQVCELRHTITGAPDTLFDSCPVIPQEELRERIATEAVLAHVLTRLTLEALHQSYQQSWHVQDLWGIVPELAAYEWFTPTPALCKWLDELLRPAPLSPIPVHLAGELYESSLSPEERKAFGQYYTPLPVVRHVFDQAGYVPANPSIIGPVLDVATGCGVFLGEIARRQARALYDACTPLDRVCHLLREHLQGYDLHPFAIIATKLYVFANVVDELDLRVTDVECVLHRLQLPGIRCADTLTEVLHEAPTESTPTWVVGNPPYGQCREGPHLDPFRAVLHGRANLHQLFLSAALMRCAPGGRLAFLVPESLRAGRFFDHLRQHLADEATLVATTDFHARTSMFPGVAQGVLILVWEKHKQEAGIDASAATPTPAPVSLVSVAQAANEEDLPTVAPFLVPASWVQRGSAHQHILLKAGSREAYALLGKLWSHIPAFPHVQLEVHTGRLVWNQQKGLLGMHPTHDPAGPQGYAAGAGEAAARDLPVIYAPSVHRYAFSFPPSRNNHPREHLLYGRSAPALEGYTTAGEVILIQRTTSREQLRRVIATLLPAAFVTAYPRYLIENHVNHVNRAVVAGNEVSLSYILGLLNSRLVNFLFAALSGTTQVSAAELRLLPLLYPGPDEAAQLAALVQRRLHAKGQVMLQIERAIDQRVYTWYGLSESECHLIDAYHAVHHTSAGTRMMASAVANEVGSEKSNTTRLRASSNK